MKNKHDKYLGYLVKIAKNSVPCGNHRLSACIVFRGDMISTGVNQLKSHPLMSKYGKNSDSIFLHAEIDAIKNALKVIDLKDLAQSTLYIARIKKDQNHNTTVKGERPDVWGNAKPCIGCMRAIETFEIKKVVFTTDEHEVFNVIN